MKNHLPVILLWVFFLAGQAIYVMLKAWKVVVSPKNPMYTYSQYFQRYWIPLLARIFAGTCLFILVQAGNGFTTSFAPDFFANVKLCGVAGLCGLGTDGLLEKFQDKVPFLKNFLPDANGNGNGNGDEKAKGQAAGS